jgi:hypothetical protein|tara:strand:- start:10145 stop:10390 length:246 start_codon:yes stop_codon:yes gene_type:complete
MARNYQNEYRKYQGTTEQKKRRAMRNAARRNAIRNGTARKGDGKDVHHVDGNPMNNSPRNTRVVSASSNRSFKRDRYGRKA